MWSEFKVERGTFVNVFLCDLLYLVRFAGVSGRKMQSFCGFGCLRIVVKIG